MSFKPHYVLFILLSAVLSACGGDGTNNGTDGTVTINVDDNGQPFTYQTTRDFQATIMPKTNLTPPEVQMFDALNAERAKGGTCHDPATGKTVTNAPVPALQLESHIYAAATQHANAMINQDFEGHLNPDDPTNRTPTRRMVDAGYKPLAPVQGSGSALFFEESLAYGFLTAAEVLDAWKKESFDHCMTVYVNLTYGAVAVKDGLPSSKYSRYWVLNVSGNMPIR